MNLCSNQVAERVQPWLGTLVSIRVEGLPQAEAHRAIDSAFIEIAAIHRLMGFHDPESTVVNAGGDIRVQGEVPEPIRLATGSSAGTMPVLELTDGSIAGSNGREQRRWHKGRWCGPHVDDPRRAPASIDRFAWVIAERCMVADALTKVVMAEGLRCTEMLRKFGASAYLYDSGGGWQRVEAD